MLYTVTLTLQDSSSVDPPSEVLNDILRDVVEVLDEAFVEFEVRGDSIEAEDD